MLGAILLAGLANVGFASGNLAGGVGARRFSAIRMALFSALGGALLIAVLAPFKFHGHITPGPLAVNLLIALGFTVAYPMYMRSLEKGNATINGVIAGASPFWSVVCAVLFFGEKLSPTQVACIVLLTVGIIASSVQPVRHKGVKKPVNIYTLYAFIVSLIWGAAFTFIAIPVRHYGAFETNTVNATVTLVVSSMWLGPRLARLPKVPFRLRDALVLAINVLGSFLGGMAYNTALQHGNSSIVAPIAGASPGLFAIASYFLFKDKLTRLQIAGVALLLLGIIGLTIASL